MLAKCLFRPRDTPAPSATCTSNRDGIHRVSFNLGETFPYPSWAGKWPLLLLRAPKRDMAPTNEHPLRRKNLAWRIAGWVLSRFVELNPPRPIGDYIGTAGRRVVAWAQLDTAPDPTGEKPQYVVAATRGGEGQPCDFTSIRVYTWGAQHKQYETSFAQNNLCGRLPVLVSQTPAGPEFRFTDDKNAERAYRFMGTVVHRIAPPGAGRR